MASMELQHYFGRRCSCCMRSVESTDPLWRTGDLRIVSAVQRTCIKGKHLLAAAGSIFGGTFLEERAKPGDFDSGERKFPTCCMAGSRPNGILVALGWLMTCSGGSVKEIRCVPGETGICTYLEGDRRHGRRGPSCLFPARMLSI